jgi:hypothetical protein
MDGKFIAYFRVSTDHQGVNGNGMAAQRKAVEDYLNGGRWKLVGEFTEVESGKRSDRPELERALVACRKHKAKLVIAKLDRLSRNVHFIRQAAPRGRPRPSSVRASGCAGERRYGGRQHRGTVPVGPCEAAVAACSPRRAGFEVCVQLFNCSTIRAAAANPHHIATKVLF